MNKKFKYFHSLVSVSAAKEASLILRYIKRNSVFRWRKPISHNLLCFTDYIWSIVLNSGSYFVGESFLLILYHEGNSYNSTWKIHDSQIYTFSQNLSLVLWHTFFSIFNCSLNFFNWLCSCHLKFKTSNIKVIVSIPYDSIYYHSSAHTIKLLILWIF